MVDFYTISTEEIFWELERRSKAIIIAWVPVGENRIGTRIVGYDDDVEELITTLSEHIRDEQKRKDQPRG